MMRIEYDPQLIEQSVLLAVRSDPSAERELHKTIDPVYEVADAEQRERTFVKAFAEWFDRLSLGRMVNELIAQRPLISEKVNRCVIREAHRRRNEGAELCIQGGGGAGIPPSQTVVIQLCPQSVVAPDRARPHLRRELLHVSDMLDGEFGYEPRAFEGSLPAENLIRDRYRCLWSTYVEGRLVREGEMPPQGADTRAAECARLFGNPGVHGDRATFDVAFNSTYLTHVELLDLARQPQGVSLSAGGAR